MYMWMDWIVAPKANAQVAEYFGEAPAQSKWPASTPQTKNSAPKYHAEEPAFWKRVYYWETPLADCGDGSERLQGLQRVGPGLDLDQGMSRDRSDACRLRRSRRGGRRAAGSPTSSTAAPVCRWGPCWRAGRLAGHRLPRLARRPAGRRASGRSTPSAASWSKASASKTSRPSSRNRSTRTSSCRTVVIAALVTVTDALLAFPIAFYMAKVASRRAQGDPRRRRSCCRSGRATWSRSSPGATCSPATASSTGPWSRSASSGPGYGITAVWLVMSYLWLPYMILPIYAGLERIPDSLISASEDLGASPFTTFRRVILPLSFPAVVAGSIFTFSLTLGDYITPRLVSNNQFIGNVDLQQHLQQPAARLGARAGADRRDDRLPAGGAEAGGLRACLGRCEMRLSRRIDDPAPRRRWRSASPSSTCR